MRKVFVQCLMFFLILVALHGCMIQRADENEGSAQEEATTQELVARRPFGCSLPIKTGPCRAYFQRYAFDPREGDCVKFVYGGCDGNANNFKSYGECWNRCVRFPPSLRSPEETSRGTTDSSTDSTE